MSWTVWIGFILRAAETKRNRNPQSIGCNDFGNNNPLNEVIHEVDSAGESGRLASCLLYNDAMAPGIRLSYAVDCLDLRLFVNTGFMYRPFNGVSSIPEGGPGESGGEFKI